MYSCSYGNNSMVLSICFSGVMVSLIGPYSCLLFRMCNRVLIKIYRTIILPVVLYGCETWSLALRVFENRMLKTIFGPKRDEVTREWRKQNNEELNDLYSSPNIVRVIKSRIMR